MRKQQAPKPGYLFAPRKKLKKAPLTDCLSIAALEDGWIINKDGSLALGFEITLLEDEQHNEEQRITLQAEWTAALAQLPRGTCLQKLAIYWEEIFQSAVPNTLPFFQRKTSEHLHGKPLLKHRCVLFLRFFAQAMTPLNNFLALGNQIFKTPFENLAAKQKKATRAASAFAAAMPSATPLRKLDDQDHAQRLYQYTSLTFQRKPIRFEQTLVALPNALAMGVYLKSVKMTQEPAAVYYTGKHTLGQQGVTMPFSWRISHFMRFPHIVAQHIELIEDKKFRKAKNFEMAYSAQLALQAREKALAAHRLNQLVALEKIRNQKDLQIVKLSLQVLAWHPEPAILAQRVDQIQSQLGKLGMETCQAAHKRPRLIF